MLCSELIAEETILYTLVRRGESIPKRRQNTGRSHRNRLDMEGLLRAVIVPAFPEGEYGITAAIV